MLMLAGPLTTIVVTPWISFDPVSLPKLVVLTSLSFFGGGLLLAKKRELLKTLGREVKIPAVAFLVLMCVTLFASGSGIVQQVFGVFGRNTGLLAYTSLVLILLCSSVLQDNNYYRRILYSLVYTSFFMTVYCLVQMAGLDPIMWSQYDTFGTLGNINFLSAFLGLSILVTVALTFDNQIKTFLRIVFLAKSFLDTYIIFTTGSIQGLMMVVAGIGVLGFFLLYIKNYKLRRPVLILYGLSGLGMISLTSLGIVNKGPLAPFIFQPSVVFRGDYWHAGWALTLKFPFFGAGLDSYGDWYREIRGLVSTTRTNPDRIANTAHNIFLDISASGGFLLLIPYLFLIGLIFFRSFKYLRNSQTFDPVFTALFIAWLAYQVQALVSINQIGVGVWGFLFSGCLLGYQWSQDSKTTSKSARSYKFKGKLLGAKESLVASVALLLGVGLAVTPMAADVEFRNARNSGSAQELLQSTESLGASLFHKELALDLVMQAGEPGREPALQLAKRIVTEHPRSFFTWVVLLNLPNASEETRAEALEKIKQLDPFNPNYR